MEEDWIFQPFAVRSGNWFLTSGLYTEIMYPFRLFPKTSYRVLFVFLPQALGFPQGGCLYHLLKRARLLSTWVPDWLCRGRLRFLNALPHCPGLFHEQRINFSWFYHWDLGGDFRGSYLPELRFKLTEAFYEQVASKWSNFNSLAKEEITSNL